MTTTSKAGIWELSDSTAPFWYIHRWGEDGYSSVIGPFPSREAAEDAASLHNSGRPLAEIAAELRSRAYWGQIAELYTLDEE